MNSDGQTVERTSLGNEMVGKLDQNRINVFASSPAPVRVLIHPGMISSRERNFLYNLTHSIEHLDGAIVDAGIFLGASTKAFASAIQERDNSNTLIRSYDIGVFNAFTAKEASRVLKIDCAADQSFDWILEDLLHNEKDLIEYHFGDLTDFKYEGGSITIAFLDVMKDREVSQRVVAQFFPHLTANAVIIHQDYFHPQHPWIPVVMARNAHLFEYVGRPQTDEFINTAIFALKYPAESLAELDFNLDLSRQELRKTMELTVHIHSDPVERLNMLGALCVIEASFEGNVEMAREQFVALAKEHGISDLLQDPKQKRHVERIELAITVFARGGKQW